MQRDLVGSKDSYATEGDVTPLPFTHGIEVEYLVSTTRGQTFGHGAFEKAYTMLINDRLKRDLEARIPDFYKKKVKELSIAQSSGSSYEAVFIKYETRHGVIESEIISVDRNVAEWPLIEAATPPCETLYELAWWSSAIQMLISSAVRATGLGASILACGTSPMEDIQKIVSGESFVTAGEHHHLAVYAPGREAEFTRFYHLLRTFVPELILLTSDSTFASGKPTGRIRLNDLDMPFPRCTNTLRVINNRKHLCDFHDAEYVPYLEQGWKGKENFIAEFQKQSSSYRKDSHFLDIDPLSKGGTTEIRIFDSQPSAARRVGVAAILVWTQILRMSAKSW
jgi:gamma-glutamyl:cysteine ligase YbdK (ATP-grasp superfamily)